MAPANQGRYKKTARPWGAHHLRYKTENGVRYVLHATKGWKRIGRVS